MRYDQNERVIIETNAADRQEIRDNRRLKDHGDHYSYHNHGTPAKFGLRQRISEQGGHQKRQCRSD
ncbi:hypothetical protein D3C77_459120 [compost metagenome]